MGFKKAEKKGLLARIALCGPSGSGKTYWGLQIASVLADSVKKDLAVIDTENGSASKYADLFEFDVNPIYNDFAPSKYIDAMRDCGSDNYGCLLVDSLTHAWAGSGGALDIHTKETDKSKSGNSYMAWGKVTPLHNALINAMLAHPTHLVTTMRSKVDYIQEKNKFGKTAPKKVGMAPVQREGMDYEFDIVGEIDTDHNLVITKSRCPQIADELFRPDKKGLLTLMEAILGWVGVYKVPDPSKEPVVGDENKLKLPTKPEMLETIEKGLAWLKDNEVDGFESKTRVNNSLKKHFGIASFEAIEGCDPILIFDYVLKLRDKRSAWLKTEGK